MKRITAFCPIILCWAVSVLAQVPPDIVPLPTVGVYDENINQPNTVDFEAIGSTWSLSSVHQTIGPAYAADFAGVYQGELISSGHYLLLAYGASQAKWLVLDGGQDLAFWGRASGPEVFSISEGGLCAGPWAAQGSAEGFAYAGSLNGVPGERLVALGLTVLSASGTDFGVVTAEASFSDGSTATASRHIAESGGLGDTFFGFTAPPGASFMGLKITAPGGHQLFFDDVVFATIPEPSAFALVALALVGGNLSGRRKLN